MARDLRIIYMGTPEFAVPSLEILIKHGFKVVAVVTAPDKPKGRGLQVIPSPVKEVALKHNIPVLQPTNLKAESFHEELRSFKANLQIVVAFRMLPEVVWAMPEIGTFNLHASLLPQYRGAAPINWAIINGEKETGLTTFFLKHEIDTGHIIFQEKEPIHDTDTVGTLYERLMAKGAQLVLKTVQAIAEGEVSTRPQVESEAKHAPKIFRETCEINWDQPAVKIHNLVRGLSPYPAAFTHIEGQTVKIYATELSELPCQKDKIGQWETDGKSYLRMHTQDKQLAIKELQMEGKKRMPIGDFLRGHKLSV